MRFLYLLLFVFVSTAAYADCTPANDLVGPQTRTSWVEGGLVYDTTNDVLKTCDGTNWTTVGGGNSASVPSFSVYRAATAQTAGVNIVLDMDTKTFDTANSFNLTTDRYTPTVAGKYFFRSATYCSTSSVCQALIYKNGVNQVYSHTSGAGDRPVATVILDMNGTTDYVEARGYASTGASDSFGNGSVGTTFSGFLIGGGGGGSGTPGGANTQVQFNNSGVFGGSANLVWDNVNNRLGIGTTTPQSKLDVTGASTAYNSTPLFRLTTGTGAGTDEALTFGVHDTDYAWAQAIKQGTAFRNLVLQPNGGNVGIGTTGPTNPLSVDGTGMGSNDSAIVAYTSAANDVFSIMPWSGMTYLGSGLYFKDGAWVHDGYNASNAVFAFGGGSGATWYASNNGTASWNVASAISLWNASGVLAGASSRTFKEGFRALDKSSVLDRISHLKIDEWKYRHEPGSVRHIGPVAEDWHEAFGTGDSDKYIPLMDGVGVTLVGVQALKEKNDSLYAEVESLRAELKAANDNYEDLRREVDALKAAR
ncbi:tail fiber domain-containing protein [Bradyrhizobium sp. LMTR 3]|uniref:tail fiber domain-containing protein n=1 Tax=Bradyrhizobium sp. LMTR 3 TaxID=189873 RepID=UPI000810DEDE|nr:tail fiber domain-containing protein [Bradyrhizobium sp. LMTR 3]OCK55418.1 hypothetical protein LMTR3_11420 [Bradyrhizobium sp. LMTR 3]